MIEYRREIDTLHSFGIDNVPWQCSCHNVSLSVSLGINNVPWQCSCHNIGLHVSFGIDNVP